MSLPKVSESYPIEMMDAIMRAHSVGEVTIHTDNPSNLRLQFNGLRGALRKEGKSEIVDQVSFHISHKDAEHPWMMIRLRSAAPGIADIAAALKGENPKSSAVEEAEASLDRILGNTP